uniref:Expressed conserved protein n=1 Tax=Echinococcus granulosus TaxID=6210 RepID=A0A068X391_ECHGR|nr:expressed conserved protein [Echinococcus granulosus]
MRQRIILPIKLYGSSSITLNERLESSASRRTAANPLGIRRSNAQRTPIALRLGQQFNNSSRGRGRPRKVDRRDGLSSQTAPVFTPIHRTVPLTSGRGGNFRGGGGGGIRGRSVLTRGRGAPRALAKRRGTRRFNRGAATNPQQMRANLDKELNEYMGVSFFLISSLFIVIHSALEPFAKKCRQADTVKQYALTSAFLSHARVLSVY